MQLQVVIVCFKKINGRIILDTTEEYNPSMMTRNIFLWFFVFVLSFIVFACSQQLPPVLTVTSDPVPKLTQYTYKPTATIQVNPTQTRVKNTSTPIPKPTATPETYKIVKGDTLLAIAFRFGLTLEEILAANPQIDPQFLVIGTDIIIPIFENSQNEISLGIPTVVPLTTESEPICYPQKDSGLWCFYQIRNNFTYVVGNITGAIRLYEESDKLIESQSVPLPVNYLFPNQAVPIAAYFPVAMDNYRTYGEITSALKISLENSSYLPVKINSENVTLEGITAHASGIVFMVDPSEQLPDSVESRVVVIAYDQTKNVIGLRQKEFEVNQPAVFTTGWYFDIQVFSVKGDIQSVEIIVEVTEKPAN